MQKLLVRRAPPLYFHKPPEVFLFQLGDNDQNREPVIVIYDEDEAPDRFFRPQTMMDIHRFNNRNRACPSWCNWFENLPQCCCTHFKAFLPPLWDSKSKKWICRFAPAEHLIDNPSARFLKDNNVRLARVLKLQKIQQARVAVRQVHRDDGFLALSPKCVQKYVSTKGLRPRNLKLYLTYFWKFMRKHRCFNFISARLRSRKKQQIFFDHGYNLRRKIVTRRFLANKLCTQGIYRPSMFV